MKRAGYIVRKTPLRRTRMRRKAPRRLDDETDEDRAYKAWGHTEPCYGIEFIPGHICDGPIQLAHLRDHTGAGLKEGPRCTVPLCMGLHDEIDGRRNGKVRDWPLEVRKTWMRGAIAEANRRFDSRPTPF